MIDCTIEAGASPDQGFHARQQARIARRKMIAEREDKRANAIATVLYAVFGFVFFYLLLFYAGL